jgi:protein tyrosine phosphatase
MTTTVVDFVKMLYERECGVVVMLCGCEEGGVEVCAQYWPESTGTAMKHGELLVTMEKVTERDGITQRLIIITDSEVHS